MAKDGTNRGGARPGAGRKRKALAEKIESGNPGKHPLTKIDTGQELEGVDMPPPKDYLSAEQRDGSKLCAGDIYRETFSWLSKLGCEKLVSPHVVEQYAMCSARWVQCEEAITKYGAISKHPTTGAPIQSPYVAMSHGYMKQSQQLWYQIYQIVRENCSVAVSGATPQDDMMERLLRARNG